MNAGQCIIDFESETVVIQSEELYQRTRLLFGPSSDDGKDNDFKQYVTDEAGWWTKQFKDDQDCLFEKHENLFNEIHLDGRIVGDKRTTKLTTL